MVHGSVKDKILGAFVGAIKQRGGASGAVYTVEDMYDDCCYIVVPDALEALGQDFFDTVTDLFRCIPEVECVGDTWKLGKSGKARKIEINVRDGNWDETDEDRKRSAEALRRYTDPDYALKVHMEERAEKLSHWKDYLLEVPPPPKHWSDELYLTMAYEPYDWIRNGEKTTEFRAYTPSYAKRLLSHPLKTVKFQRGYGGPGHSVPEQMVFEIKGIKLYDIYTKTEADPSNPTPIVPTHFAIDLGKRIR